MDVKKIKAEGRCARFWRVKSFFCFLLNDLQTLRSNWKSMSRRFESAPVKIKTQVIRFCYKILRIIFLASAERQGQVLTSSTNSGYFSKTSAKYDAKSVSGEFVSVWLSRRLGGLCSGFVNWWLSVRISQLIFSLLNYQASTNTMVKRKQKYNQKEKWSEAPILNIFSKKHTFILHIMSCNDTQRNFRYSVR